MTARRPASPVLSADHQRAGARPTLGWAPDLKIEVAAVVVSCVLGVLLLAGLALVSTGVGGQAVTGAPIGTAVVTAGAVGRSGALTLADMDALSSSVRPTGGVTRLVTGTSSLVLTDTNPRLSVVGVDSSFTQVSGLAVARGTFFTTADSTAANRVAVLGQAAAARLFPNGQSPIQQTISIRRQPFIIVGVLAQSRAAGGVEADNTVFVPFQTGQIRLFGTLSAYQLLFGVRDASEATAVRNQVQQVLRQRHHLVLGQPDDFTVQTAPTSSPAAGGGILQTVARILGLVHQYTCTAKAMCSAPS